MEILCPYCCSRFPSNKVHFRLNAPLEDVVEEDEEVEEENIFGGAVGRQRGSRKSNRNEKSGKKLDEKLYNYYKEYFNDEAAARQDAMQYDFVEFDVMNKEIEYNRQEMNEYGYVNRIGYRGQDLTTRLCPNCHKNLVDGAGKFPMYMFSVIGDTNVGKSIYLTVLEAMIEKGAFDATMLFMGTKEEHDYYRGANKRVMQDKKMLKATIGKVPPLTFQLTYSVEEEGSQKQRKSVLITFCDIPGEMCRDKNNLEIFGAHLRASSGLMFLIDPTRFKGVRNVIDQGAEIDELYQMDVIEAINRFLVSESYEMSTNIPTAIMITKSDTLKSVSFFQESESHRYLIDDQQWNVRHPNFVNEDEIQKINRGVSEFLNAVDEVAYTRKLGDLFSNFSFFINSALGHAPADNEVENIKEEIRTAMIRPYRITEAFYWILAENGVLPRRITQVYRNSKSKEEKTISIYYYENYDKIYINQKIAVLKEQQKIKDCLLGGKWELVRTSYS